MHFSPKMLVATLTVFSGLVLSAPAVLADDATPVTAASQTQQVAQTSSSQASQSTTSSSQANSSSQSSSQKASTTPATAAKAASSTTVKPAKKATPKQFQAHVTANTTSQSSSSASSSSAQPTAQSSSQSAKKTATAKPATKKVTVKKKAKQKPKIKTYNRRANLTKTINFKHHRFYAKPKTKKTVIKTNRTTTKYYHKKVHVTRQAKTVKGIFFKTYFQKQFLGWVNKDATLNRIYASCKYPYKLTIQNRQAKVYTRPAGTKHAKRLGTVNGLKLTGKITGLQRKDLNNNKRNGYIKFKQHKKTYWIKAQNVKFRALSKMKGHNSIIERAISAGMKWVGRSKYNWGGGRTAYDIARHSFDCSSFVHYMYAKAGIQLGNTATAVTYSEVHMGKGVAYKNMRRGDILFFTAPGEGVNCHVGLYLGKKLFINDSPSADTGGVGISSLRQKGWYKYANGNVRRIV